MNTKSSLHNILRRPVIGKYLLVMILWTIPVGLLLIFIFSVYPNYILKGHHNNYFIQIRSIADRTVRKILPQKVDYNTSVILNSSNVALKEDSGLPPKVFQPLLVAFQPNEVSETPYFSKPTKQIVFHAAMVPDPYTTYAPLPGKIAGLVFHNKQQFRYPVDLEKKKVNEIRVFIAGGSVAWGSSASDVEFTIAGFMEKELRKKHPELDIKVITAAAGGWTSTQERIWIFNRITEYEPDLIITYSGYNDVETYLHKDDLFDKYAVEGWYFREAIRGYDYYNRGEAISMLGYKDTGSRFKTSDFPRKSLKNNKIVNSYLKSIFVPYVYVLQPILMQVNQPAYDLYKRLGYDMAIQAEREGYQFIDHSALLVTRPEFFLDSVHPGDRGYQIIANDLLARIDLSLMLRKVKERQRNGVEQRN